jgi:hypothetical protein
MAVRLSPKRTRTPKALPSVTGSVTINPLAASLRGSAVTARLAQFAGAWRLPGAFELQAAAAGGDARRDAQRRVSL